MNGIIQEVFKKEKSKPRHKYFSRGEINPLLDRLQQELIEKIKQALKDYDIDIQRILIGDNQE